MTFHRLQNEVQLLRVRPVLGFVELQAQGNSGDLQEVSNFLHDKPARSVSDRDVVLERNDQRRSSDRHPRSAGCDPHRLGSRCSFGSIKVDLDVVERAELRFH